MEFFFQEKIVYCLFWKYLCGWRLGKGKCVPMIMLIDVLIANIYWVLTVCQTCVVVYLIFQRASEAVTIMPTL